MPRPELDTGLTPRHVLRVCTLHKDVHPRMSQGMMIAFMKRTVCFTVPFLNALVAAEKSPGQGPAFLLAPGL